MPRKEVYQTNKEHFRVYAREYRKTQSEEQIERIRERSRKYQSVYRNIPEVKLKQSARLKLNYAVHKSKILEREICDIENCNKLGDGHHEDYSKSLEVRWLCRLHHEALHHNIIRRIVWQT